MDFYARRERVRARIKTFLDTQKSLNETVVSFDEIRKFASQPPLYCGEETLKRILRENAEAWGIAVNLIGRKVEI